MLIVQYSVAAYGSAPTAVVGGLMAFAGVALSDAWSAVDDTELGVMAALAAGPWLAGWFARPLRREAEELAVLAAELERQREARTRLAVAEERAHLARELNDAVAHSVSAMVIQGAAAEAVLSGLAGGGERLAAHGADAGARVGHRAAPHAADPAHRRGAAGARRRARARARARARGDRHGSTSRWRSPASRSPSGWS